MKSSNGFHSEVIQFFAKYNSSKKEKRFSLKSFKIDAQNRLSVGTVHIILTVAIFERFFKIQEFPLQVLSFHCLAFVHF